MVRGNLKKMECPRMAFYHMGIYDDIETTQEWYGMHPCRFITQDLEDLHHALQDVWSVPIEM